MLKNPLDVLNADERASFLAKSRVIRFRKGVYLFRAGEEVTGIYHLRSGVVKVTQVPGKNTRAKAITVRMAGAESWIGHRSLFTSETYRGSARAKESGEAHFIPIATIRELFAINTAFAYQMARLIIQDLERTESSMFESQRLNLPSRLIQVLRNLAASFGSESNSAGTKGIQLSLKISRVELSEMVGSSPEAVSRQISSWKKLGMVKDSKNGLFLAGKLLNRVTRR